ncbi:GTP-binding protein [methanotrophic endosymbiont of Bathymodiolus puteoserpentis (Logatchev)]|jgi:signal recognition particle receptor subunit beta|uniref:GTP-binding protein n=1 Tax=methanotrophic endosymbiont of Bathymodiolus puteoserpentis (Logatchev) TaxID=343235 RepID=UPI0013C5A858|nr:ATP/GTP-binding protein [methanotrophic endosymbiont of Bathymodiolus puteoserpentis (Logatchev)]SHE21052.1 putative ATP/GTP-binding protein [methanotrophic endosymbiont of Bathymodiolus puteoserpentis (Logatchev)]
MSQYKIIFTGPVGAGKTTAISSLSDVPLVKTDEAASDMTKERKAETTVAMDYGIMHINEGEKIHLYGTPGQERFDFMWDILTAGGIGLVLLLDNSRTDPFKDMQFFLKSFAGFIQKTGVAIGVTQMDISTQPTIDNYHQQLKELDMSIPVFSVDAREKKDVSILVQALMFSLDPGIEE